MIQRDVTGVDLQDRLAVIRDWARDGQHAVSGEGGVALRCVEALCAVATALAERVAVLEREVGVTGDVADHAASYDERIADLEARAAALELTTDIIHHAVIPEAIRRHRDTAHNP